MASNQRNPEQQAARREVDAFVRECEAYLRETIEDEWIGAKSPDLFGYLWERLKEASSYGLEDKMLIMKYMTAAVLTDEADPIEQAGFAELRRDLEGGEYDEAQLLDAYIREYLDADEEESQVFYIGQNETTDEIIQMLAVALRSSIRRPFVEAAMDVERLPGFVDFNASYRDADGNEIAVDDLLLDDAAIDALHQLYAITVSSGAEDWNRLTIAVNRDTITDVSFSDDRMDPRI